MTTAPSQERTLDPAAEGRAVWWAAGATALVLGAALGARIDTTITVGASLGLALAVSFVRAALLAPKVRHDVTAAEGTLALRVGIIGERRIEPVWSRAQAVLRIGGGTTALSDLEGNPVLSAPSTSISFRAGSGVGKGGIWVEAPGQQPARFTAISGPDLAAWGAHYLIDKPLIAELEALVALDGGSSTAAPSGGATPPPGWHPDPGGEARLRWWDGTRWTDHTA